MAFAAVTVIAAVIISALGTNIFHAHELRTPLTFVLAGAAGLAGSALGVYLLQRYAPVGRRGDAPPPTGTGGAEREAHPPLTPLPPHREWGTRPPGRQPGRRLA